jgi:hypothetical protein
MDIAEYALVAIPAASGLVATVGGVLLTLRSPNYRAVKAAFWMAAVCFGSLGIVWGVTAVNQPMILRLGVAGITAAAAAMALTWILAHLSGDKRAAEDESAQLDQTVQVICEWSQLPTVIPQQKLYELELVYGSSIGGVFVSFSHQPGTPINMVSADAPSYAWRCRAAMRTTSETALPHAA